MESKAFPKTLIVVKGTSNSGKTSSIRLAFERLTGQKATSHEIDEEISYGKLKLAFCSEGDSIELIEGHLDKHMDCDVIITACKSMGQTSDFILEKLVDYQVFMVGSAWSLEELQEKNDIQVGTHILILLQGIILRNI